MKLGITRWKVLSLKWSFLVGVLISPNYQCISEKYSKGAQNSEQITIPVQRHLKFSTVLGQTSFLNNIVILPAGLSLMVISKKTVGFAIFQKFQLRLKLFQLFLDIWKRYNGNSSRHLQIHRFFQFSFSCLQKIPIIIPPVAQPHIPFFPCQIEKIACGVRNLHCIFAL